MLRSLFSNWPPMRLRNTAKMSHRGLNCDDQGGEYPHDNDAWNPPGIRPMSTSPQQAVSKILLVDDDHHSMAALRGHLGGRFQVDTAPDAVEALDRMTRDRGYGVVVAGMEMPGMNGVEFLERAAATSPDTMRIILSAQTDSDTRLTAVNRAHVFAILDKPCSFIALESTVESAFRQHEAIRHERDILEGTVNGSIKLLVDILGVVSPDALGRGQRMRDSMRHMAKWLGKQSAWELETAALLSSVGYAAIPVSLLRKAAAGIELEPSEAKILCRAPRIAHDLIADIPRLAEVARIVLYQDKRYDGGGFPEDTVAGDALPLGSRILKILIDRADLEEDGIVKEAAHTKMKERVGCYDISLLESCFGCFPEFLAQSVSSEFPVVSLAIDRLVPGHIVVSDIYTGSGIKLIGAGHRLTSMMLERLRNLAELKQVQGPVLVQTPRNPG